MTFTQGVLVEPLSIGVYTINHLKDIKAETIGILGTGPIPECFLTRHFISYIIFFHKGDYT